MIGQETKPTQSIPLSWSSGIFDTYTIHLIHSEMPVLRLKKLDNFRNKIKRVLNFDELDESRFGKFYKRKRNFDQVDEAGFGAFNRYF